MYSQSTACTRVEQTDLNILSSVCSSHSGRDTTASTLSWAFYELDRNPLVKQKLIREVASMCGTGEDVEYSFETMNELLKYTVLFLKFCDCIHQCL